MKSVIGIVTRQASTPCTGIRAACCTLVVLLALATAACADKGSSTAGPTPPSPPQLSDTAPTQTATSKPPCASSPFGANETAIVGWIPSATGTVQIPELGLTARVQQGCFELRNIELPESPILISFEIAGGDKLQPATWADELVLTTGTQVTFTPVLHIGSAPERVDPCPALLAHPEQQSAAEQLHASLCLARTGAGTAPATGLSRLVYALDYDLWVKDLPDGVPHRIASHGPDAEYSRPKWSPSGQWLTFRSGKWFGVMRADGSDARTFVKTEQIAWSPVADRLAYTTLGAETAGAAPTGTLFVESADGSEKKAVARWSDASDWDFSFWEPAWSPDGTSIAYVEQSGPAAPPPTYAGIWQVQADGSSPPAEVYRAANPTQEDVGVIGWTPAGAILFSPLSWLPSDRYPEESASSDGVTLHEVRPGAGRVVDFAPMVPTMLLQPELRSFAPTGDLLVITEGAGRETWTNKRIALLSTASGTVVGLTDRGVAAIEPSWSPDAQRIAYAAASAADAVPPDLNQADMKAAMAPRKIWVMDTYANGQFGANPRQLTSDPAYRDELPQWAADGSQILFARLKAPDQPDEEGWWSLWIVPSSGGAPREVVPEIGSPESPWRVGYDEHIDVRGVTDWFDWWRGPRATGGDKPAN